MPNAFAPQLKNHAKNIPFFFKLCKKAGKIQTDFKEPSHAQNLEIVARLFGYTDFHHASNDVHLAPKFNGETQILLDVLEKLNPDFDFKHEVNALRVIKLIVSTIGLDMGDEVVELGRYSVLRDEFPAKWGKIAESTLYGFLTLETGGLWKAVASHLLFNLLTHYENFNNVQAESEIILKTFTAFKPTSPQEKDKLTTALEILLPSCVFDVYDDKKTTFAFADDVDSQAMLFDICYGPEFVVKGGHHTDPNESRIELRRKMQKHRDYLNAWANCGFSQKAESRLYEVFNHTEIISIKGLCAVFSYAVKVFLNLSWDQSVFQEYVYFDGYGSLSFNLSNWIGFSVEESSQNKVHDFDYSYLSNLPEIQNTSSMNYIIFKIIENMSVDIQSGLNRHRDNAIAAQYEFATEFMKQSIEMYYLFHENAEPKVLNVAQEFLARYFIFTHQKPNLVDLHFKQYHLVNVFPI